MSVEYALEKYPLSIKTDNGLACEIRPLSVDDENWIKEFYLTVPEHERLFIKERLTDGHVFHEWCQGGWKSHIGLVSELTHPEFRGIGLSKILLNEIVEIGRHAGLHRLEAEFTGDRKIAIHEFAKAGFSELVRLPNYVKDIETNFFDYVVMGLKLKTPEEFAGVG